MFDKRLRTLRENKGMSQKELAEALTLSPSTIGMYEQGSRQPDHDKLLIMADYFGVTTDYLLGHEVHEEKANYVIKEVLFPNLAQKLPNIDIDQYISGIREALYKAVNNKTITPERAEKLIEETTRYLMFQIEQLNKEI